MRLRLGLEILLVLVAAFLFWAADRRRLSERTARTVAKTPEEAPPRDAPATPLDSAPAEIEEPPEPEPLNEEPAPATSPREDKPKASPKRKPWSKWDPPADLGHLDSTPYPLRVEIDELVNVMMDWEAGRDSLGAKEALIEFGKPAFPRILGAMAEIRDTITDEDSTEERLLESSLKLADEALREMDGWLTAKAKSSLRPGSEKRYIAYICRLHYKRWMQKLKDMPEMPGPYDPSREYEDK